MGSEECSNRCTSTSRKHTAQQLAKKLIDMAEGVGLTPHSGLVTAVTIDTTATNSTMLAAGRLLPFEYMGCFDLTLNLGAAVTRSRSRRDHTVTIATSTVLVVKLTSKAWYGMSI